MIYKLNYGVIYVREKSNLTCGLNCSIVYVGEAVVTVF